MRALIFTDVASSPPRLLTAATMAVARERSDVEVCGFVTTNPEALMPSTTVNARRTARRAARRLTRERVLPGSFDLGALSRKTGLPVLVPDKGVNDQAFIDRMHDQLRPDVLLSYFFTRILKQPILDSFDQAVNYHDGLLPYYGGLAATAHSVYEQQRASGYTFHRMTVEIDGGAVLAQGTVPIGPADTGRSVGQAKAEAAAAALPRVIDMIVANDPGIEQVGSGSYYPAEAMIDLTTIEDPTELTSAEITLRVRAFGSIEITIDGTAEYVTEVADGRPDDRFGFPTADGHLRASRLAGIPARLIEARRKLRR